MVEFMFTAMACFKRMTMIAFLVHLLTTVVASPVDVQLVGRSWLNVTAEEYTNPYALVCNEDRQMTAHCATAVEVGCNSAGKLVKRGLSPDPFNWCRDLCRCQYIGNMVWCAGILVPVGGCHAEKRAEQGQHPRPRSDQTGTTAGVKGGHGEGPHGIITDIHNIFVSDGKATSPGTITTTIGPIDTVRRDSLEAVEAVPILEQSGAPASFPWKSTTGEVKPRAADIPTHVAGKPGEMTTLVTSTVVNTVISQ